MKYKTIHFTGTDPSMSGMIPVGSFLSDGRRKPMEHVPLAHTSKAWSAGLNPFPTVCKHSPVMYMEMSKFGLRWVKVLRRRKEPPVRGGEMRAIN